MSKEHNQSGLDAAPWAWPHFSRAEVSCRHCGELYPADCAAAIPVNPADTADAADATDNPGTIRTTPAPHTRAAATLAARASRIPANSPTAPWTDATSAIPTNAASANPSTPTAAYPDAPDAPAPRTDTPATPALSVTRTPATLSRAAAPSAATATVTTSPAATVAHIRASLDALERLRALWGRPIVITSGHRCVEHNRRVGGAPHSQHLRIAFDCACPARLQSEFIRLAKAAGFRGIGRYPQRNFVHLDLGPTREWSA